MISRFCKPLAIAILVVLTFSSLAACGDSSPTTLSDASKTNVPTLIATTSANTSYTPGKMIILPKVSGKLTIWHSYGSGGTGEGRALEEVMKQFRADNPDARIEVLDVPFDQLFTKFKTEAALGGGPDLFIAPNDSLGELVRANLLLNLDSRLSDKLENILPVAVDGSKVDGKLYIVPQSLKAVAMFYNKTVVKEAPKTTDDLLKLAQAGVKIGFNNSPYYQYGFFGAFGGKLFDSTGKSIADQGGFAEALQWMQIAKTAGVQFYTDGEKFDQAFQTRQLDIVVEGPWKTTDFKKALGNDLGVAPMPGGPAGPATPFTGVDGWYINQNSKNPDNALNFAIYMTSPKVMPTFVEQAGHVPADKTLKINDPLTQQFAKAVASGFPRPQIIEMGAYWENFGNALNLVIDKKEDPRKTVLETTAKINIANNKK